MEVGYYDMRQPHAAGEYNIDGYLYIIRSSHIKAWEQDKSVRFNAHRAGDRKQTPIYELTTRCSD